MFLGKSSAPAGIRLYAIGDVHGRDDLLADIHARVAADLQARPVADHRLIHMGDYVDRGPASAAVIDRLARMAENDPRVICLKGNHEELFQIFLALPTGGAASFLANGGDATLASYGVAAQFGAAGDAAIAIRDELLEVMPQSHRSFLSGLRLSAEFGDYFFCHAGIRPGVPLAEQDPHDLVWIRDVFHRDPGDHGKVVIHAHTPVPEPDIRRNRINIDTGAWFSGRLTCLALEARSYRFV